MSRTTIKVIVADKDANVTEVVGVCAMSIQKGDIPGVADGTLVLIGAYAAQTEHNPTYFPPAEWDRILFVKEPQV